MLAIIAEGSPLPPVKTSKCATEQERKYAASAPHLNQMDTFNRAVAVLGWLENRELSSNEDEKDFHEVVVLAFIEHGSQATWSTYEESGT